VAGPGGCGPAGVVGGDGVVGRGVAGGEQARRIAALGARPRRTEAAVATLSGSERRVAALAARGCTNREISERLTITASTVEQHLTRIFRKLGVRSRQELPAETVLDG
ncbi:hypothetical protein GTY62_10440, partial [Streptomyces sp. SID724]|uniref:LuxR C-terminal-related transcriptional regulator n=1 Tax=Streptomyces sp. SID724 TaxID=2690324 RepID=UPI0013614CC9|nr:hypothetical protein [Streptomyces sp. SID724]